MSTRSNSTPAINPDEIHDTARETPIAKEAFRVANKPSSSISASRFKAVRPEEESVSDSSRQTVRPESDQSEEVSSLYEELDKLSNTEGNVDELRNRIRALRNRVGAQDACATGRWQVVKVARESKP